MIYQYEKQVDIESLGGLVIINGVEQYSRESIFWYKISKPNYTFLFCVDDGRGRCVWINTSLAHKYLLIAKFKKGSFKDADVKAFISNLKFKIKQI